MDISKISALGHAFLGITYKLKIPKIDQNQYRISHINHKIRIKNTQKFIEFQTLTFN